MRRLLESRVDDEDRSLFVAGVKDSLPLLTGIVPFSIIVGITGVEFGLTAIEISVMSALAYAGSSQLAAIFLMADNTTIFLVVVTAVLINVRFAIYSASMAPRFQSLSWLKKVVYSFLLVDTIYALLMSRFPERKAGRSHWYYFGGGLALWSFWTLGTVIGAGMGVGVPESFPVDLVLPLVFIALLFPILEGRPSAATAVVAGGVATVAAPLDYNFGLLVGVGCGLVVGVSLNR
jgi:4-azaleucine resistance transporter AzlC